jgi:natural product precursor
LIIIILYKLKLKQMKKVKLLSKQEMKKVMGGSTEPSTGCKTDSDCGSNERCCSVGSKLECKTPLPSGGCPLWIPE